MHTHTPWRIGDAGHTVFGPPNGNPAPKVVASNLRKDDAQLIVRAVNTHAELLEALKGMLWLANDHEWEENNTPEILAAKAAVAKAEGRE